MTVAIALAVTAVSGAALGVPAPSALAGLVAIPVGLYAALATSRALVPFALGAAAAGALTIAWWIHELIEAISSS